MTVCAENGMSMSMSRAGCLSAAGNYGADQMAETCEIRTHITKEENQVLLQVSDSGKGMTAD